MSQFTASSRFSRPPQSSTVLNGVNPLPFAPTLDYEPSRSSHASHASGRVTTPLAPPPPPLSLANPLSASEGRRMRYAGAEHTLGPTFSEEEDGDDSAWIASKMAVLGLDPNGTPYRGGFAGSTARGNPPRDTQPRARVSAPDQAWPASEVHRQQQPQLYGQNSQTGSRQQQQIQYEALQALGRLQNPEYASNTQYQAHALMQAQAQRALLAAQLQQGYADPRQQYIQQAQLAALQQQQQSATSFVTASEQRSALAAQVQANLLARTNRSRVMNPDDADLRARFESAPNIIGGSSSYKPPQTTSKPTFESGISPYGEPTWRSFSPIVSKSQQPPAATDTTRTNTPPRFTTPSGSTLSSFLSRRRATDESSLASESDSASVSTGLSTTGVTTGQTSPNASIYEDKSVIQTNLGYGRPQNVEATSRAYTVPAQTIKAQAATPRAASHAGTVTRCFAVRQPYGPPGEANELGERNFQSRIRRQAGLNLGMLGRRTETPTATPVLA